MFLDDDERRDAGNGGDALIMTIETAIGGTVLNGRISPYVATVCDKLLMDFNMYNNSTHLRQVLLSLYW